MGTGVVLATVGVTWAGAADAREVRLAEAFADLTQYRFTKAEIVFSELAADASWSRWRDASYGQALALLNAQPRTADKIARAHGLLESVRAGGAADDLGLAARYFLARVQQVHLQPADPERARLELQSLAEEHPEHYLGQMAQIRLAFIELFAPGSPEEKRAVFERYDRISLPWVDEHLRAVFHTVVGDAIMVVYQDTAWATRHYRYVTLVAAVRELTLVDALVRIGETARLAGVPDVARDAYEQLLTNSPRDPRAWLIQGHLEALEGGSP